MEVEVSCCSCQTYEKRRLQKGIRAIFFDCDGVLVDSEHTHYLSWRHALQKQGYDLNFEEYLPFIGQSTETDAMLFSRKIGKDCAEEILHDKVAHYRKLQGEGIPPMQATIDFIHRLAGEKQNLDLKLGVASAVTRKEILGNLRNLGIEKYFDVILSGCEDLGAFGAPEEVNKPKPYIYQHAADLLGLTPSQCVVIEDSHTGIRAGVDAGCFTVALPNQYTFQQDLSKAHLTMESFANLSVEDFLKKIVCLQKDLCG